MVYYLNHMAEIFFVFILKLKNYVSIFYYISVYY
jgi:hypothetical protein